MLTVGASLKTVIANGLFVTPDASQKSGPARFTNRIVLRKKMEIAFGDNVRILSSPETEKIGLSGKTGQVYGETTPSSTSVTVIGELIDDYAINVSVDDAGGEYWFSPNLLEFINHGEGTEITIGNRGVVRNADGSWEDFVTSKKWWQFWR